MERISLLSFIMLIFCAFGHPLSKNKHDAEKENFIPQYMKDLFEMLSTADKKDMPELGNEITCLFPKHCK